MTQVLLCGAAVVTLSMGIRHGFGLFLQPMTMDRGWSRETFAFALAIQNLAWGLFGPLAGMLADRFGAFRVLLVGGLLYAGGLMLMAVSVSGLALTGSAGLMLGMAQAGTTYAIVFGVVARNVAPEKRSWAMGVTAAAGSFGQFLLLPVGNWLIGGWGWQSALFVLGLLALAMLPLAFGLREPSFVPGHGGAHQSVRAALREAAGHNGFRLLAAGYFVCGFQLAFIGVHLPSYLKDQGLQPGVASTALALVGLFNVFGSYLAGSLGQRFSKPRLLSTIYLLRAAVIVAFISAAPTAWSVYLFSAAMGLLWLSTVPATNAVVAQIFGVQYMSMLGGIVFLNHQIGAFLGAWLGGRLYVSTGSYDLIWWICAALGVFAAIVNWPVRDTPIVRPLPQAA